MYYRSVVCPKHEHLCYNQFIKQMFAEVAKFITLRDMTIWNLQQTDIKDFVSLPTMNPGIISKEYLFPNFLAQCASNAGIYGIQYGSVQDNNGWNIALFHYGERESIAIIRTSTYELNKDQYRQK
jgi:hypothetical protein